MKSFLWSFRGRRGCNGGVRVKGGTHNDQMIESMRNTWVN